MHIGKCRRAGKPATPVHPIAALPYAR
jgi:hypothetical protein